MSKLTPFQISSVRCRPLEGFLDRLEKIQRSENEDDQFVELIVLWEEERCFLCQSSTPEKLEVNSQVAAALKSVLAVPCTRYLAYLPFKELPQRTQAAGRNSKSGSFKVNVNVYGRREDSEAIGKVLSDAEVFLQDPEILQDEMVYQNPHILWFEGISESDVLMHELISDKKNQTTDTVNVEWSRVLDDLLDHYVMGDSTSIVDARITTELMRY